MSWSVLRIAAAVVVAILAAFFLLRRGGGIDSKEAHRLVEGGALLVDVRTESEFRSGHLAGAINIPVQELDRRAGELGPKDRTIVLYCRSGVRSARAARELERAGYGAVHNLGPMARW